MLSNPRALVRCSGDMPVAHLKMRRKAAGSRYPTFSATRSMGRSAVSGICFASSGLSGGTYPRGVQPVADRNPALGIWWNLAAGSTLTAALLLAGSCRSRGADPA